MAFRPYGNGGNVFVYIGPIPPFSRSHTMQPSAAHASATYNATISAMSSEEQRRWREALDAPDERTPAEWLECRRMLSAEQQITTELFEAQFREGLRTPPRTPTGRSGSRSRSPVRLRDMQDLEQREQALIAALYRRSAGTAVQIIAELHPERD